MGNKRPSINRLQAREVEKKVVPAIKQLSNHMFKTSPETPDKIFYGYKCPAGRFTDAHGKTWEVQIHAYRTKKDFIKKGVIQPIINSRAVMFKIRVFLTGMINEIFKK